MSQIGAPFSKSEVQARYKVRDLLMNNPHSTTTNGEILSWFCMKQLVWKIRVLIFILLFIFNADTVLSMVRRTRTLQNNENFNCNRWKAEDSNTSMQCTSKQKTRKQKRKLTLKILPSLSNASAQSLRTSLDTVESLSILKKKVTK